MSQYISATTKEIDGRLAELTDELRRLEAARAALVGGAPAPPANSRRPGRPRAQADGRGARGAGRRAGTAPATPNGSGRRAREALELVRSRPGITIPELADAMKIAPNYLYRVMPKLASDGQVKKKGQGWQPLRAAA